MKKKLFFIIFLSCTTVYGQTLKKIYEIHCRKKTDINEHLPILKNLASQCSSAIEIGLRDLESTWGILQGLSESSFSFRSYLGIDISSPPSHSLSVAKKLAEENQILFTFWKANDMEVNIPTTEFLFIDSFHTYVHLTYELEKFSPNVKKYIALHDTSEPWGYADESYQGDYSEYPAFIDKKKHGLWTAVVDFLDRHPEWILFERKVNSHGLTILRRLD